MTINTNVVTIHYIHHFYSRENYGMLLDFALSGVILYDRRYVGTIITATLTSDFRNRTMMLAFSLLLLLLLTMVMMIMMMIYVVGRFSAGDSSVSFSSMRFSTEPVGMSLDLLFLRSVDLVARLILVVSLAPPSLHCSCRRSVAHAIALSLLSTKSSCFNRALDTFDCYAQLTSEV